MSRVKKDFDAIQKASAIVGGAILAVVGSSVKVAAEFEAQMSRVKAISGATAEEFEKLNESALDLGAKTSKSASEVAIAMEDLAAMGFDATEIMAAMPGVIAAAEASGSDLALTAGVVAAALNGFGLEAGEASRVADILAMTANVSAAGVDDMGYALKYVGPIANALGITLEETSATIGIMTNAGLDGSNAGTALRAALIALNNPAKVQAELMEEIGFSMRDSNGEAKGLSEMIGDLQVATEGMTEAEKVATIAKLVGSEASAGIIAVMAEGPAVIDEMTHALENSAGAADAAAAIMMDNVLGSFEQFTGAIESLGIEIGNEFLPVFKEIIDVGTDVIEKISELDTDLIQQAITFAGVSTAIAFVITTLGKLMGALRLAALAMGPAGWAVIAISALGGLLMATAEEASKLNTVNLELADSMIETGTSVRESAAAYDELKSKSSLTSDEFGRFLDIQNELKTAVTDSKIAELTAEQEALVEKSGLSNEELTKMVDLNGLLIEKVPEAAGQITEQGNRVVETTDKIKEYNRQLEDATIRELERQKIIAEGKEVENKQKIIDLQAELEEGYARETTLRQELVNFDEEATLAKIAELELALQAEGLTARESQALRGQLDTENEKLELSREGLTTQMEANDKIQTKIDKLNTELGLVYAIDGKMIDTIMTQQGLNSEKGKEIAAIDKATGKLEAQKKKLHDQTPVNQRNTEEFQRQIGKIDEQIGGLGEARTQIAGIYGGSKLLTGELGAQSGAIDKQISKLKEERSQLQKNTPAAKRNTDEYRNGIAAIDAQIGELQGVKSQIDAASSAARALNNTLSAHVSKTVTVRTIGGTMAGGGGNSIKDIRHHTGGIAGQGPINQMPQLHTGGLASQFTAPMQHEVDIRALKGEMILTESQQANLMRMIDAGHTAKANGSSFDPAIASLLSQIAQNTAAGKNVSVTLSSDAVFESTQGKLADEITTKRFTGGYRE